MEFLKYFGVGLLGFILGTVGSCILLAKKNLETYKNIENNVAKSVNNVKEQYDAQVAAYENGSDSVSDEKEELPSVNAEETESAAAIIIDYPDDSDTDGIITLKTMSGADYEALNGSKSPLRKNGEGNLTVEVFCNGENVFSMDVVADAYGVSENI